MSLKYPYGPSAKKIGKKPFFVDTCGNFNGYISDTTRTFIIGQYDKVTRNQIDALIQIKQKLRRELRPNINLGKLYGEIFELAKELKISEHFMGDAEDKVAFLGHGIGLELDELPILYAKGKKAEQGNVLACEPKYIEKGKKVLGLEDSYVIKESGNRLISQSPDYFEI
jgi:Xaa-Pro aminopeptidase